MEEVTNKSGMSTGMIIGIAVIVAIVFGGGAYAYVNNKAENEKKDLNAQITELQSQVSTATTTTPSASTSATATDETASWKTYTSSTENYSIKYPSNWYLYGSDSALYIQESKDNWTPESAPSQYASAFEVSVKSIVAGKTISDAVNDRIKEINSTNISYDQKSVTIDGQPGIKLTSKCDGLGCGNPDWLVIKGGKLFTFKSNLGYTATFDKILSSFQFTK